MPYGPGGVFSLVQRLGTGTPMDNMLPPLIGADLDDIATALKYAPGSGTIPSFRVRRAAGQGGFPSNAYGAIGWDTLDWNVGGFFAANVWTPPAGKIHLSCTAYILPDGGATAIGGAIGLFKNGGFAMQSLMAVGLSRNAGCLALDDIASGTDTYGIQLAPFTSPATTSTLEGGAAFFSGHWISA